MDFEGGLRSALEHMFQCRSSLPSPSNTLARVPRQGDVGISLYIANKFTPSHPLRGWWLGGNGLKLDSTLSGGGSEPPPIEDVESADL